MSMCMSCFCYFIFCLSFTLYFVEKEILGVEDCILLFSLTNWPVRVPGADKTSRHQAEAVLPYTHDWGAEK